MEDLSRLLSEAIEVLQQQDSRKRFINSTYDENISTNKSKKSRPSVTPAPLPDVLRRMQIDYNVAKNDHRQKESHIQDKVAHWQV